MIIGVTGASGSGKSTVAEILKNKLNCYIVDADVIAKTLSKRGNTYYDEIVKAFGDGILDAQKEIIRSKLAKIIYSDDSRREILNNITNIYVVDQIKRETFSMLKKGTVIIDVPRLIESGLNEICDVTVGVIADEEIRLNRICNRDKISKHTAKARLRMQPDNQFYIDNLDYLIENDGDDLEEKIDLVIDQLKNAKRDRE